MVNFREKLELNKGIKYLGAYEGMEEKIRKQTGHRDTEENYEWEEDKRDMRNSIILLTLRYTSEKWT